MKKKCFFMLLAMLILLPLSASAATLSIEYENVSKNDNSDGTRTEVVKLYATSDSDSFAWGDVTLSLSYGNAFVSSKCEGDGAFILTAGGSDTLPSSCTFSAPSGSNQVGKKVLLGKFTRTYKTDAGLDCAMDMMIKSNEFTSPNVPIKPNPGTGVQIPYAVIGGGVALAAVVFLTVRRQSKFYKI